MLKAFFYKKYVANTYHLIRDEDGRVVQSIIIGVQIRAVPFWETAAQCLEKFNAGNDKTIGDLKRIK